MNVSYRTNFILRMLIPLYLFTSYFFISHSRLTLFVAVIAMIHVITFGVEIHRKGKWNKINLQHDQRTQENARNAGNIVYWLTIGVLVIGSFLIQKSVILLSYQNLIIYTILLTIILKWGIRDFLNNQEAVED
jgi:membrane protein required for beta-lactamase induction